MGKRKPKSFNIGDAGERRIINLLTTHGVPCHKNEIKENRFKYDVLGKLDKKNFSVEVKFDVAAARYGNIAIEIWNNKQDKPSGLYVTEATFWGHVLDDMILMSTVQQLKDFVAENAPCRHITFGGDENAELLLYDKQRIVGQVLMRVDDMTKDDFLTYLRARL